MVGNNKKLFKKLNEKMEMNSIKTTAENLSEAEKAEIEKKVVFERSTRDLAEALDFTENR